MPTTPIPTPTGIQPPVPIDPATGLPITPPATGGTGGTGGSPTTPPPAPAAPNTSLYLSNYTPPGYSGSLSDWLQQNHPDLYSAYQGNGISLLNQFAGGLSGPAAVPNSMAYFQQLQDYINSDAFKQGVASRDAFNMFQDQTPDPYGNVTHGNIYGEDPFGYTDALGQQSLDLQNQWNSELQRAGASVGSDFGFGTQAAAMDFLRQNGQAAFDAKVNPLIAANQAAMKRAQALAQELGLGPAALSAQSSGGWSAYADDLQAQKAYQDALAANPNDKNLASLKSAWDAAQAAFQGPRGQAFQAWDQAGQPGPFQSQDGSGWFQSPNGSGNMPTVPQVSPQNAPGGNPWGQFTSYTAPTPTSAGQTNGQLTFWGFPNHPANNPWG